MKELQELILPSDDCCGYFVSTVRLPNYLLFIDLLANLKLNKRFETMVFSVYGDKECWEIDYDNPLYQEQYDTEAKAEERHIKIVLGLYQGKQLWKSGKYYET